MKGEIVFKTFGHVAIDKEQERNDNDKRLYVVIQPVFPPFRLQQIYFSLISSSSVLQKNTSVFSLQSEFKSGENRSIHDYLRDPDIRRTNHEFISYHFYKRMQQCFLPTTRSGCLEIDKHTLESLIRQIYK